MNYDRSSCVYSVVGMCTCVSCMCRRVHACAACVDVYMRVLHVCV